MLIIKKYEIPIFYLLTAIAILGFIYYWAIASFNFPSNDISKAFLIISFICQGILILWMIRDCINKEFKSKSLMINWIVAIALLGVFGTTLYYIKVKKKSFNN